MSSGFGWNFERYLKFGGYPAAADLVDDQERWQAFIWQSPLGDFAIEVKSGRVRNLKGLYEFVAQNEGFVPITLDLEKGEQLLSSRKITVELLNSLK